MDANAKPGASGQASMATPTPAAAMSLMMAIFVAGFHEIAQGLDGAVHDPKNLS